MYVCIEQFNHSIFMKNNDKIAFANRMQSVHLILHIYYIVHTYIRVSTKYIHNPRIECINKFDKQEECEDEVK